MITAEKLMAIEKEDLQEAAEVLDCSDIPQVVAWLKKKDDKLRYQAFQLLTFRSAAADDVYEYWDDFCIKLKGENSYQRSIGLMLIAENTKWDIGNRIDQTIDAYLDILQDEKPITVRQCIQSLSKIICCKPHLLGKITGRLTSFDLSPVKETMRKLILIDIINVLILIRKTNPCDEIERFISAALSGEILDKKSKKQIEALL